MEYSAKNGDDDNDAEIQLSCNSKSITICNYGIADSPIYVSQLFPSETRLF